MLALVSWKEVYTHTDFETAPTRFVSAARNVSDIQCFWIFFPLAHHLEFEGEIADFTSYAYIYLNIIFATMLWYSMHTVLPLITRKKE